MHAWSERRHADLAELMLQSKEQVVQTMEQLDNLPAEEQQDTEFYGQIASAYVKEILQCLSYDPKQLFSFAYALRS